MTGETVVEFRLITKESSRDADKYLGKAAMVSVPMPGELVNLIGNPYRVAERSWSIESQNVVQSKSSAADGCWWISYCYIRVTRAGGDYEHEKA